VHADGKPVNADGVDVVGFAKVVRLMPAEGFV